MLSIEITRECPLSCPGCYAYGETHLGGEVTLRDLHDLRVTLWSKVSWNSCASMSPSMFPWWAASR